MRSILIAAIAALAIPAAAFAQPNPPQRGSTVSTAAPDIVKSFAPTGRLRAAINQGNSVLVQKQADGSEPKGVTIMLAKELGQRLGVPVELVLFNAAGEVFAALKEGRWDIAFLAVEPVRAAEIDFTAPYVIIEGAYMVPKDSPLKTPADVDNKGIRIAVGRASAYDLYLTRTIKNAEIVRASTGGGQRLDRPVPQGQARGRGRRSSADRRLRQDQSERAGDGAALHGDRAGDGHAEGPRRRGELSEGLRRGDEEVGLRRRRAEGDQPARRPGRAAGELTPPAARRLVAGVERIRRAAAADARHRRAALLQRHEIAIGAVAAVAAVVRAPAVRIGLRRARRARPRRSMQQRERCA